jgi:hypothetical protein
MPMTVSTIPDRSSESLTSYEGLPNTREFHGADIGMYERHAKEMFMAIEGMTP